MLAAVIRISRRTGRVPSVEQAIQVSSTPKFPWLRLVALLFYVKRGISVNETVVIVTLGDLS